jgi:hypothetical protein
MNEETLLYCSLIIEENKLKRAEKLKKLKENINVNNY